MQGRKFVVSGTILLVLGLLLSNSSVIYAQDISAGAAAAATSATELLVYDLNRAVTKRDHGFPKDLPPRAAANGDWTTPVNFAEGTLYFRVQIRRQPTPQDMKIQFCVWQYKYTLENCVKPKAVRGTAGNVVTWSQTVQSMWKKGGNSIDWVNPRQRYGLAIKTSRGKPVSSLKGWNWSGQNPNAWYPLDMHVTVVVVAKGASFGGWNPYLGANDTATASEITVDSAAALENENADDLNSGSGLDPEDLAAEDANTLFLPFVSVQ